MIFCFDLDDTLYDEGTYVRSGFRAVSTFLEDGFGISGEECLGQMVEVVESEGRGRVFDEVLERQGLRQEGLVERCVEVYRGHWPTISPAPGAIETLERCGTVPLYLVTDGDPEVQATKVRALGLEERFRRVHRTWSYGLDHAKPSTRCFQMICDEEGRGMADLCYVGDDPTKDFVGLNAVGAVTVRVLTGRHSEVEAAAGHEAAIRIPSIAEFDPEEARSVASGSSGGGR